MTNTKRPFDASEEDTMISKRISLAHDENDEDYDDDDDDDNKDDDDSSTDSFLSKQRVSWETSRGEYTAEIKVGKIHDYGDKHIGATLFFDRKAIGTFEGTILPRPTHNFYQMGDSVSYELDRLTKIFCNSHGAVTRVSTNLEERDIGRGGFFHIYKVSINKTHKGQDLGLRMVHEILAHLREEWNLVVLSTEPMFEGLEERLGITRSDISGGNDHGRESDTDALIRSAKLKLAMYWARIGFSQVGRAEDQYDVWYMTSLTYFGPKTAVTTPSSMAMTRWKTNDEVQSLDIYVPPKRHTPRGVDKELHTLVMASLHRYESLDVEEFRDVLRRVRDLVLNKNACVHGSRVLFDLARIKGMGGGMDAHIPLVLQHLIARRNIGDKMDKFLIIILRCLIDLSPDAVNAPDEYGDCPLHIAAFEMNPIVIEDLINGGASLTVKSGNGWTPLQYLERKWRDVEDFRLTFYFHQVSYLEEPMRESILLLLNNFIPSYASVSLESMLFLMTNDARSRLVDDWLPPRMMKMFLTTAATAAKKLACYSIEFESNHPKSRRESVGSYWDNDLFFEYIPTSVLERNSNGLKSFVGGWHIVWEAIASLLHRKQVPKFSSVKYEIIGKGSDFRKWNHFYHFVGNGGKVEYALDGLLCVTRRNVVEKEGDYWDYENGKEYIEEYPETPLDKAFDVARLKCMEISNNDFVKERMGPYEHDFS